MREVTNTDLCDIYEVGIYRVDEVFEGCRGGVPVPEGDRNKWFVSAPTGIFPAREVDGIPLADTIEEAAGLAVKHLGLRELHQTVCALRMQAFRATGNAEAATAGIRPGRFPTSTFDETPHRFFFAALLAA